MDVYGIQKKNQIKLNDSLNNMINNIKLPLVNLKEQKQFIKKKYKNFTIYIRKRSKSTKEMVQYQQKNFQIIPISTKNKKKRKLKNLGKAYEVPLDKIDEMQENFFKEKIIPVGRKYKEKILLESILDMIPLNQ